MKEMVERGLAGREDRRRLLQEGRQARSSPSTGRPSSTGRGRRRSSPRWRRRQNAPTSAPASPRSWPARTRRRSSCGGCSRRPRLYAAALRPRDRRRRGLGRPRHGVGLRLGHRARSGCWTPWASRHVAEQRRARGPCPCPPLVETLLASGRHALLRDGRAGDDDVRPRRASLPVPDRAGVVDLAAVEGRRAACARRTPGASLVDLGDGCALVEFHSKMNALGQRHLRHAADRGQGGARPTSTRSWSATRASNFSRRREPHARPPRRPGGGVGRARPLHPPVPEREHGPEVRRRPGGGGALRPHPGRRLRDQPALRPRPALGRDLHGPGRGRGGRDPRRGRHQGAGAARPRPLRRRGGRGRLPLRQAGLRPDRLRQGLDLGRWRRSESS